MVSGLRCNMKPGAHSFESKLNIEVYGQLNYSEDPRNVVSVVVILTDDVKFVSEKYQQKLFLYDC